MNTIDIIINTLEAARAMNVVHLYDKDKNPFTNTIICTCKNYIHLKATCDKLARALKDNRLKFKDTERSQSWSLITTQDIAIHVFTEEKRMSLNLEHTINIDDKFRNCVGILLINNAGKILAGQRYKADTEYYQMPQGGIHENEDPHEAAIRELEEETSITNIEFISTMPTKTKYYFPDDKKIKYPGDNNTYIGQIQTWIAFYMRGKDSEININREPQEFANYQWVTKSFLIDNVVPFKKPIYEEVLKHFSTIVPIV